MNRTWYNKGRAAARRSNDMYAAWRAAKGKPGDSATNGRRITAQESFFQGFQDATSGNREGSASFSNPARQTKAAKREKTRKASVERRAAAALRKYLKIQNPGMKAIGAAVQKLKRGVLKITPIKATRGRK